jgi:hypothetical protein
MANDAKADLDKALPALEAALDSLKALNKVGWNWHAEAGCLSLWTRCLNRGCKGITTLGWLFAAFIRVRHSLLDPPSE